MKLTTLIILFLFSIGSAQFFEENHNLPEEIQAQDYGFAQDSLRYEEPSQGLDKGPGNTGDPAVPIDQGMLKLLFIGLVFGLYFSGTSNNGYLGFCRMFRCWQKMSKRP